MFVEPQACRMSSVCTGVTIHIPNDPIQYTIRSKLYDMYRDIISEFIKQKKTKIVLNKLQK